MSDVKRHEEIKSSLRKLSAPKIAQQTIDDAYLLILELQSDLTKAREEITKLAVWKLEENKWYENSIYNLTVSVRGHYGPSSPPTGTESKTSWLTALKKELQWLKDELKQAREDKERVEEKYYELIYQVAKKHPNESRHETALRYIKQAENRNSQTQAGEKEQP